MRILLSFLAFSVVFYSNSQQTITSVSDGFASDPSVWDCICIPPSNSNVIIEHNIEMNSDWLVNGSGSITVTTNGTFIEDNDHRGILFDGIDVEFSNHGLTELTNLAFSNGAIGHNHATLSLDTGLWVDQTSTFMNHGDMLDLDSTYTQGMFMNEGNYGTGDFLNEGTLDNTGYITADSMLNTSVLNHSAGKIEAYDFANTGELNITGSGFMVITHDFFNSGEINLANGRDIRVANDMMNAHDSGIALIINDGLIEVGNDFSNVDTLRGTGVFCIANNSSNLGDVKGTLDICDNTSVSHFDFNSGNIEPSVTNCSSGCNVSVEENKIENTFEVYPNPVRNTLNIKTNLKGNIHIIDVMGNSIIEQDLEKDIDVSKLKSGVYFITLDGIDKTMTKKFIKK
ncbi:MAG: T9SS type A sorting domain-containing protein [Brumimicrobium sp.]